MGFYKLLIVLPLILTVTTIVNCLLETRIIGGVETLPHEYPHQISLQWNFRTADIKPMHFCGGSLLNEEWILTAAHCKIPYSRWGYTQVVAGVHDINIEEETTQRRDAAKFITHPNYPGGNAISQYDVAVIKVFPKFDFNVYLHNIVLPARRLQPTGYALVSGWGSISITYNHEYPTKLRKVVLPIVPYRRCRELWGLLSEVRPSNVCAGYGGDKGACTADSGGPLIQIDSQNQTVLIGIVSWGPKPCGERNKPSVFLGVSNFVDWIQNVVSKE